MSSWGGSQRGDGSAMLLGHYLLKETIGVGTFGKVKVGEHELLGTKVAIKMINRDKIKDQRLDVKVKREIHNMRLLRHPHIVQLFEVIETSTDIFIVLEYISGGELFDYIISHGKLTEAEGRYYFQQIISAMSYCHRRNVSHRDLKPENLLLDVATRTIKIADFGLSSIVDDGELLKTACGSPNYAAPEVISGKYYSGPEADVWSCGIILYALLTARLPFDDNYIPHLFNKIRAGKYAMPRYLSLECQDLIKHILVVNPVERITMTEIRSHSWFKQNVPKYLDTAADALDEVAAIDAQAVSEVASKLDMTAAEVEEDIRRNREDPLATPSAACVMYQILMTTSEVVRFSNPATEKLSVSAAKQFASSPPVNLRDEMPFFAASPKLNINIISAMSPLKKSRRSSMSETETPTKQWYLGLISRADPHAIMVEVVHALRALRMEWKTTGIYQLRCRPAEAVSDKYDSDVLKLGVQLFAMPRNKQGQVLHLLDLKRIEGGIFDFFDICSALLARLKHLEHKG